jgi:hypothetical protein
MIPIEYSNPIQTHLSHHHQRGFAAGSLCLYHKKADATGETKAIRSGSSVDHVAEMRTA